MATQTQEIRNMRLISHHDLNGFGNIGEGMHIHQTRDGRRILYLAHESAPKDITSVDVTDIANPRVMVQTEHEYPHLRSNSLSIVGDTMLVAYQSLNPGQPGTGMGVYDISNVEEPRRVGFLDTSGPYSRGCHCLWWVDGNYAHLSTGAADFQPRDQKDDQFYMIVDVNDPTNPVEAGRWWFPGVREGDDAPPVARHPQFDSGHRLHNANVYPERPDRAWCAYMDSGVVILDISDVSNPSMISHINYAPPFPGFTHTVVPLFNRDLMVVTQEAVRMNGEDYPKLIWMMDIRDEGPSGSSSAPSPWATPKTSSSVPAASAPTTSTKTSPAPPASTPTTSSTAPSSTAVSASSTPATPSSPKRWPTSCRSLSRAPPPSASTTSTSTKTASCTW